MKRVIRNIPPESAYDLLERVPRACIAFPCDHGPQVQPVTLLWSEQRYIIGIPETVQLKPEPDQEIVLLVDEGVYFFDLRAIYIRGQLQAAGAPVHAPPQHEWFELLPTKTVAWDYGSMREESYAK